MDINKLVAITPSERQLAWQALEFAAFLHYGMNTFTNREWGDGTENPMQYNPCSLSTDQWCEALSQAGVKACIITAKHHDGFCLFDTAHTKHSVMYSANPVDVVAELSRSCAKYGLKLGIYLSPWDRHEPSYGSGKAYDDFFCAQLEELTTRYGPLYALWFDGACGEGRHGKTQVYNWNRYYEIIRKNQPDAVISISGPDVRWIGNEAGITRPSEWSVVPTRLRDASYVAAHSQSSDDIAFRNKPISPEDLDLGSRAFLETEGELCWYPAEVDVSIRPGWFYHESEDGQVRSLENLLGIYEKSVGGNAALLLNVPPDKQGRINAADTVRLKELGDRIKSIYSNNLLSDAKVFCSTASESLQNILINDESYWSGEAEQVEITLQLPKSKKLTHFVLCEQICQSQRIEGFSVYADMGGIWQQLYEGTTVGYKKICRFEPVATSRLRVRITESRIHPTLRFVGAYAEL